MQLIGLRHSHNSTLPNANPYLDWRIISSRRTTQHKQNKAAASQLYSFDYISLQFRLFTQSTAVVGHRLIVLVGCFREIGVTIFARDKVIVAAVRWVGDSQ